MSDWRASCAAAVGTNNPPTEPVAVCAHTLRSDDGASAGRLPICIRVLLRLTRSALKRCIERTRCGGNLSARLSDRFHVCGRALHRAFAAEYPSDPYTIVPVSCWWTKAVRRNTGRTGCLECTSAHSSRMKPGSGYTCAESTPVRPPLPTKRTPPNS